MTNTVTPTDRIAALVEGLVNRGIDNAPAALDKAGTFLQSVAIADVAMNSVLAVALFTGAFKLGKGAKKLFSAATDAGENGHYMRANDLGFAGLGLTFLAALSFVFAVLSIPSPAKIAATLSPETAIMSVAYQRITK